MSLPVELILQSARLACLARESTLEHVRLDYTTHVNLLRVNKLLYNQLVPFLYAHIRIGKHPTLFALHRTLSQRPLLGHFVRSLCLTPASQASSELAPHGAGRPLPRHWEDWLIEEGVEWMPHGRLPSPEGGAQSKALEAAISWTVSTRKGLSRGAHRDMTLMEELAIAPNVVLPGMPDLPDLPPRSPPLPIHERPFIDLDAAVLDMEFVQIGVAWCFTCLDTGLLMPLSYEDAERRSPSVEVSKPPSGHLAALEFIGAGTWGAEYEHCAEKVAKEVRQAPDHGGEVCSPAIRSLESMHGLPLRRVCHAIANKLQSLDYTGVNSQLSAKRDAWAKAWRSRPLRDDDICSPSIFARSGCLKLLFPTGGIESNALPDYEAELNDDDSDAEHDQAGNPHQPEDEDFDLEQVPHFLLQQDGGPDTPSSRALFGRRPHYLASDEEPTLGSIITVIQSLLSMMPELVALKLSSYLERVVGGRDSRRLWPKLEHLHLGPPPTYWSSPLHLGVGAFPKLHSLSISGCLLFDAEVQTISGTRFADAMPRLKNFTWRLWLDAFGAGPLLNGVRTLKGVLEGPKKLNVHAHLHPHDVEAVREDDIRNHSDLTLETAANDVESNVAALDEEWLRCLRGIGPSVV
ncbi:hypothetical protein IE81DRAFT_191304 [Ceraceosorus guamensis]|uniref:Uncharacterized protein n=1 Tax=Ceraceosorus guamensis TaxID=1522189 RepID=A0A316W697_9BASI|nr:hypothetical protein IE81DRAFT_191304 [Ceraceosorus guamensis]PWN45446.1 hypothetical protein IE81DRAFT_191304 [Ceraceosorus guamensis]